VQQTGSFWEKLLAVVKMTKQTDPTDQSRQYTATHCQKASDRGFVMDKQQAEILYDSGKEPTIKKLLEQDDEIDLLKQKIASLTKDSTNSSKPPSSDGPQVKKQNKTQNNKNPGGQKGHKGNNRPLLSADEMDHVYDLYPPECENCHRALDPETDPEAGAVLRHQVFDLPKIEPEKFEYRCHELDCTCGHKTRAQLPPDAAQSNFGPRVHAGIAYLNSVHRVTRRGVIEIMQTLFNIDISLGATCNVIDRVTHELEPVTEQIQESLKESEVLNIDETGWKSKGDRRWLWSFVSPLVVFFQLSSSRGTKVLKSVLDDTFSGIIISDDHSAYNGYHKNGIRQLCWAHLIRKFKGLKDSRSSPHAYIFAKNMLAEAGHLFSCWHAFRESFFPRKELWEGTTLIRARMKRYCMLYENDPDKSVRTRARRMLKHWDHLFTFMLYEGVEPTNNIAESAIRPAVQWRKICFGNQSDSGERFTERILSVTRTCQKQDKNAFEFLASLMEAAFKGESLPSLV
jgi:transposase